MEENTNNFQIPNPPPAGIETTTTELPENDEPTGVFSSSPKISLEQSKMVVCLNKGVDLKVEKPNRIMALSENLKVTYEHSDCSISCETDKPGLVIIDGSSNSRYFPIFLDLYGVVYTKGNCSHIMVGAVTKSKVTNRSFPYRYCNKFMSKDDSRFFNKLSTLSNNGQQNLNEYQNSMSPKNLTSSHMKKMMDFDGCDTVFLKSDESLTRIVLSSGESLVLQSGKVLAWTLGITFDYKRFCCMKMVSTLHAKTAGVVWIHNPYRGRTGPVHE